MRKEALTVQQKQLIQRLSKVPSSEYTAVRLLQSVFDPLYQLEALDLSGKIIRLHALKAGGLGDIVHTYRIADKLKAQFPKTIIELIFQCPGYGTKRTDSEASIQYLFQDKDYPVTFHNGGDYDKAEAALKKLNETSDCLIGVAMPIPSPELKNRRQFNEYGYSKNTGRCSIFEFSGTGNTENLCMGLRSIETGLNFEPASERPLTDLQSPWLKKVITSETPLYHLYFDTVLWEMQIIGLHMISNIEQRRPDGMRNINIVLSCAHTLEEMKDWGILNPEDFANYGVSSITMQTPEGESESLETGYMGGIKIQLLSGLIPRQEMAIIEKHSEKFFGCTGDMSVTNAIELDKLPFYKKDMSTDGFKEGFLDIIKTLEMKKLENFYAELDRIYEEINIIITKNTPKMKSMHLGSASKNMDITLPNSILRKSIPETSALIRNRTQALVTCYFAEGIMDERAQLNRYIREHYDTTQRVFDTVYRDFAFAEEPLLRDFERDLIVTFLTNVKTVKTESEIFNLLLTAQKALQQELDEIPIHLGMQVDARTVDASTALLQHNAVMIWKTRKIDDNGPALTHEGFVS